MLMVAIKNKQSSGLINHIMRIYINIGTYGNGTYGNVERERNGNGNVERNVTERGTGTGTYGTWERERMERGNGNGNVERERLERGNGNVRERKVGTYYCINKKSKKIKKNSEFELMFIYD